MLVFRLAGGAPIVPGDEWAIGIDNSTFSFEAEDLADATSVASVDVAITDRDHKGVYVSESGGSTDVIEQSTTVLLGNGLTDEKFGETWVVSVTSTTAFVETIDPRVLVSVQRDRDGNQTGLEIAFLEPSAGFAGYTYTLTYDDGTGALPEITATGADVEAIANSVSGAIATSTSTKRTFFKGAFGLPVTGEIDDHDSAFVAQDLDTSKWNKNDDANITDADTVPHLTVLGSTDGDENDWYRFEILPGYFTPAGGAALAEITAVFDIDGGYRAGDASFWIPGLKLYRGIFDAATDVLIGADLISVDTAGIDPGSESPYNDGFLEYDFTTSSTGVYFIEVSDLAGGGAIVDEVDYALHISIPGHVVDGFVFAPEPVIEAEPNDTTAQNLDPRDAAMDLTGENFFTFFDPEIGGGNLDSLSPYVRVVGRIDEADDTDTYSFVVGPVGPEISGEVTAASVDDPNVFYRQLDLTLAGKVTAGDTWKIGLRYVDHSYTVLAVDENANDTTALTNLANKLKGEIEAADTDDRYMVSVQVSGADVTLRIIDSKGGVNLTGTPRTNDPATSTLATDNPLGFTHDVADAGDVTRSVSVLDDGGTQFALTQARLDFEGVAAAGETWTLTLGAVPLVVTAVGTAVSSIASALATEIADMSGAGEALDGVTTAISGVDNDRLHAPARHRGRCSRRLRLDPGHPRS